MAIAFPEGVETRPIKSLLPYANNPREHSKESVKKIAASIKEFGFNNPILIDPKGEVIAGHGRILGAEELGLEDAPVVVLPHLNEEQKKAYRIADNQLGYLSHWDINLLKAELANLKLADFDVNLLGFDLVQLHKYLPEDLLPRDEVYKNKTTPPIYEPSGEQPALSELYETSKTDALLAEIEAARLPGDIKDFLRHAAYRHIVFNYSQIAEFYAHASQTVQDLMERSALVIIDFNKAIENGFVQMSKDLAALAGTDKDDEDEDIGE